MRGNQIECNNKKAAVGGFILNGLVLRACLEGFTVNGRWTADVLSEGSRFAGEVLMNITLDYLRGRRTWVVPNFVVWGD